MCTHMCMHEHSYNHKIFTGTRYSHAYTQTYTNFLLNWYSEKDKGLGETSPGCANDGSYDFFDPQFAHINISPALLDDSENRDINPFSLL